MSSVKTNNVQVGLSLTSTNNFTWYQPAVVDGTVRLGVGNAGATSSDVMTLTSAGNVGIGTSSPIAKLNVKTLDGANNAMIAGTTVGARFTSNSSGVYIDGTDPTGASSYQPMFVGGSIFGVRISGTERMQIDTSGNLGLGVTPSAWSVRAIDVPNNYSFGHLGLSNNAYYNAGWLYKTTAAASLYQTINGAHYWNIAPSGTAGDAISFTQAMTLDANGSLIVGSTSIPANGKLGVFGGRTFFGANNETYSLGVAYSTTRLYSGQLCYIGATDSATPSIVFSNAAGTERMRITSDGEVYIAGTTDQGAYNLQVNGTGVWGAGAYVNGSDAALKENVQDLPEALNVVKAIRPVTFTYKEDYSKDRTVQTGFIAQELQQALADQPYLDGIVQAGPEHLNVAYQSLIPLLVKSIQEQQELINQLTARVAQLEK